MQIAAHLGRIPNKNHGIATCPIDVRGATFALMATFVRIGFCLALTSLLLACGGKGKKSPKNAGNNDGFEAKIDPSLCDTAGKKVQRFDTNQDNKTDVWRMYKAIEEAGTTTETLTCRQSDGDHDGRIDVVIAFNERGFKEFEKMDFDWDGKFDVYCIYNSKGQVVECQRDKNFDGQYDLKEMYEDGKLKSIRRDRNQDLSPDVWEQYKVVDGKAELVAILYDDDFDGRVDRREQKEEPKSSLPPPDAKTPEGDSDTGPAEAPAEGTEDNATESDAPSSDTP